MAVDVPKVLLTAGFIAMAVVVTGHRRGTAGASAGDGWRFPGAAIPDVVGGRIGDLEVGADCVVVAVGNRVQVYSAAVDHLAEEYLFEHVVREVAISESRLAALLADRSVVVAKRGPHVGFELHEHLRLPIPETVAVYALALIDENLVALGTNEALVFSTDGDAGASLAASFDLSDGGSTVWQIRGMDTDGNTAYGVIWDYQTRSTAKLIAITQSDSEEWSVIDLVTMSITDQPAEVRVTGKTAVVRTGSSYVYVADVVTGEYRQIDRLSEYGLPYVTNVALESGLLYVLGFGDRIDPETSFSVLMLPVRGVEDLGEERLVSVDRNLWSNSTIEVSKGLLLFGEEDQVIAVDGGQQPSIVEAVHTIVAPAFRSMVFDPSGNVVVARPWGLCRLMMTTGELDWCGSNEVHAQRLVSLRNGIVIAMESFRLVSVLPEGPGLVEFDALVLDPLTGHRYLDVVSTRQGVAVLRNTDPLRTRQANFLVEFVQVSDDGSLSVTHGVEVNTPGCADVDLFGLDRWFGVLCPDTLHEIEVRDGVPMSSGQSSLPSGSQELHATDGGVLAIGTDTGLHLYDFESRSEMTVRQEAVGIERNVVAIGELEDCVATVSGGITEERQQVSFYCPDRSGDYDYRVTDADEYYGAGRGSFFQPQFGVSPMDGMLWLTTGYGTAIRYHSSRSSHRAYLPLVALR